MEEGILDGVRVIDFSSLTAAPITTMLLGDMGAEVIRVESPHGGIDRFDGGPLAPNGEVPRFIAFARNKKGITLNLRTERGRQLARELVGHANIVVVNYTPKAAEIMGVSYEKLKEANQEIIYVSVSGFGLQGPYSNWTCLDAVAQAMSGAMLKTGFPDSPPILSGAYWADCGTGVLGALGAVLALYHCKETGKGQLVDVSLLNTGMFFMTHGLFDYLLAGTIDGKLGNTYPFLGPADTYKVRDGWVYIMAEMDDMWMRLLKVIGREDLLGNPQFESSRLRFTHRDEIRIIIEEWTGQRVAREVVDMLQKDRIPCGSVYELRQTLDDPHIKETRRIIELDHPEMGKCRVPAPPINFSRTPGRVESPPPLVGEHNEEVYSNLLGLSYEDIDRLKQEGII